MKVIFVLFLLTLNTNVFSNSNLATKDDIKMLIEQMKEEHRTMREDTNKRFEMMQHNMDKRFEDMMTMFISCFGILATVYIASIGFLFGRLASIQKSIDRLELTNTSNTRVNQITDMESFILNLRNLDENSRRRFKTEVKEILEIS